VDAHHNLLHARKRATANALPGTNTKFASEEERHTFEEPQTIEEGQSSTLTHRTITGRFTGKLYHRKHLISTNTTFESSLESVLLDNEGKARWYHNESHHSVLPNGPPYVDPNFLTSCPGSIPRTSTDSSGKSSTKSDKWKRVESILQTSTIVAAATNEGTNMARDLLSLTIAKPTIDEPS
jgi:hypothetical protein